MNYETLMDGRQAHLHERFPSTSFLHKKENVQRLMLWITYYRRNPSRFVEHYLGIKLYLYQHIMLYLLAIFPNFLCVAARSAAKSWIIAVHACKEAILYPGSQIVIASATKGQARLIVSEKIDKLLKPRSPLLQAEIERIKDSQNEIEVVFRNGSSIIVVVANDNARGHRATTLIYEEFRMIKKEIIDGVLSPFLVMRQPDFMKEPEYVQLQEPERSIYISSAWYKSHWMWRYVIKLFTQEMINGSRYCVFGLDYSIAILHNIKSREFMIHEKRTHDPVYWSMEYENQMVSENAKAYFTYEQLNKNRRLKKAFYPRRNLEVLQRQRNRYDIPKQTGEIRIVSCDIAMESGANNDNSVFSCLRLLPESQEYKVLDVTGEHLEIKRGYRIQLVYLEPMHGGETTKQAIRIKQLFEDFNADYCVLDGRNAGRLMPTHMETYEKTARKKTETLRCQSEWKAVCKSTVTRNAYELKLNDFQNITLARVRAA